MTSDATEPRSVSWLRQVGTAALGIAHITGALGVMLWRVLARLVAREFDRQELLRALHKMGVRSVPIVIVTALFTGESW